MYCIHYASDFNTASYKYSILNTMELFRQNVFLDFYPHDEFYPPDNTDDDESLNEGWRWNGKSIKPLICIFRSLLTTLMTDPLTMTAREWNTLMKMINGNWVQSKKKKTAAAPAFNVISQNIPGTHSPKNVGIYIDNLIKRFKPAILFLCEVEPHLVNAHCPPDYDFVVGTLSGRDRVRVCALIKVNCEYRIKELNVEIPTLAIEIEDWTFLGLYREWAWGADPSTKGRPAELVRLKTLMKWWRGKKGKCLVMGDFNFDPDPNPTTTHQQSLQHIRELVEAEITMRGWKQLVQEITRSWEGQKSACIDHIYTNRENFVEHVYVENTTGTDHRAVGVKVRLKNPVFVSSSFLHRSIDRVEKGMFENVFCNSMIHEVYNASNVNEALSKLNSKILRALNVVAPEKKVITSEKHAKWMTPEILVKIRERNALRRAAEESKVKEDWKLFKDCQKTLMKEMRTAKQEDFKTDMDVKNSKVRWARVKTHAKLSRKRENDIVLDVDGEEVSDPHVVSRTLNNYFKTKVVNLRKDLDVSVENSLSYTDEYITGKEFEDFNFHQISTRTVKRIISNMTNTGALGHDGIGTKVLKRWKHVIAPPLRHIINMSVFFGEYPEAWKLGLITPLPKGGNPKEMKNWRPICINPALSKVLESVLNEQISSHMESQKLYSETQHAYRKERSVTSALLELDTMIREQLNRGKIVGVLTTDVSAGFNLVSKEILIPKMARFGFQQESQELLSNYLSGRRTKVKVKNVLSDSVSLETGVGEGSVLGPNFFSCGMTDVSVVATRVKEKLITIDKIDIWVSQIEYADDCTPIMAADTEDDLQAASDRMLAGYNSFYSANGLKLNESKCKLLVIRPGKKVKTLTCAGQDEVDHLRLLGLYIDNKLRYDIHTNIVRGRIKGKLEALEKVQGKASLKTMTECTVSFIHSSIEFCAELYLRDPTNQKRVQKMLNAAMRMLLDQQMGDSCTEMMRTLNWLNVANMYRWVCIRTLRRLRYSPRMMPATFNKLKLNEDPEHDLRYNSLKLDWKLNTNWARESFISCAVGTYNALGLHGRLFADKEDARDSIKSSIIQFYGNENLK